MNALEKYLSDHPAVSRTRAERMLGSPCYFFRHNTNDYAYIPDNLVSTELMEVNISREFCPCNVLN